MKWKIRVIENRVKLPETIMIVEIPELEEILHSIWRNALDKDYKRMSKSDLRKKYNLKPGSLDLLEILMDDDKMKELGKLLADEFSDSVH